MELELRRSAITLKLEGKEYHIEIVSNDCVYTDLPIENLEVFNAYKKHSSEKWEYNPIEKQEIKSKDYRHQSNRQ